MSIKRTRPHSSHLTSALLAGVTFLLAACDSNLDLDLCDDDADCSGDLSCFFARENAQGICTRSCTAGEQCDDLVSEIGDDPFPSSCMRVLPDGTVDASGEGVCVWGCNVRDAPPSESGCGSPDYVCYGTDPSPGGICLGRPGFP